MHVSIVIAATDNRAELLHKSLNSVAIQKTKHNIEAIVLNDGADDNGIKAVCSGFVNFPVSYKHMNNKPGWWRTPATSFNTGVNMAQGDVVILACPEMYSVNDTIDLLADACTDKVMAIPNGMDDRDGLFLHEGKCDNLCRLNTKLPFFMAVRRSDFLAIGGYDEAMTGISFDDDDFVARMLDHGCKYVQTDARVIHLYHPRISDTVRNSPENSQRWLYNKRIFDTKRQARNML